jgi:hypothetical protein
MGITNFAIEPHMLSLFKEKHLTQIRSRFESAITPREREAIIIQSICHAFKENGQKYVLPFRFKNDDGTRTSHHLIFITKNFRGYEIMKEIMARESTVTNAGVANFEYNPRDARYKQGSLFEMLSRPLDDLRGMLLNDYEGQTIDFITMYQEHSVDKPYIKNNYKDVLKALFAERLITAENPITHKPPRKGTFADEMRITFGGSK